MSEQESGAEAVHLHVKAAGYKITTEDGRDVYLSDSMVLAHVLMYDAEMANLDPWFKRQDQGQRYRLVARAMRIKWGPTPILDVLASEGPDFGGAMAPIRLVVDRGVRVG